jgi:hypothetical protein
MRGRPVSRRRSIGSLAALVASVSAVRADGALAEGTAVSTQDLLTLASMASLRTAAPPDSGDAVVLVLGYHASDRPAGGGLFRWSPEARARDNGGTVIAPAHQATDAPGRWLRVFDGALSVTWFGATGDGRTDDTVAIQAAIDESCAGGALVFPPGRYRVTMLDTRRCEASWRFDHAELVAGASVATPCVLRVRGLHATFLDMRINLAFNDNYACGLWWYDAHGPSQYNSIQGLEIRYGRRGIVYGEMPGQRSTSFAQSENAIFNYRSRGIERPLYVNHANGILFLSAPQLVSHDEEWTRDRPGAFDYRRNHAFEAIAGVLAITGGEVQNSIAATTSASAIVAGGEVELDGCIIEVSAPLHVTGRLTIRGGRILNTQSLTGLFVVGEGPAGETVLKVSDCRILRNPGVGAFSDQSMVTTPDRLIRTDIALSGCDISEWALFAPLVAGDARHARFDRCRWRAMGDKAGTYLLDTGMPDLLEGKGADRAGRSLAGFWPFGGAAARGAVVRDTPETEYQGTLSLVARGVAGLFTADTTSPVALRQSAIPVRAGDRFLVEAWVRRAAGRSAGLSVLLLDAEGKQVWLGENGLLVVCETRQNFVTDGWRYLRQVVEIPDRRAAFAGFGVHAVDGEVRFCGLQVRRADPY